MRIGALCRTVPRFIDINYIVVETEKKLRIYSLKKKSNSIQLYARGLEMAKDDYYNNLDQVWPMMRVAAWIRFGFRYDQCLE